MRILLIRLAGMSAFLAILASPAATPQPALGSTLTPQSNNPLCSTATPRVNGLTWDIDTQRCVFGSGGCAFYTAVSEE